MKISKIDDYSKNVLESGYNLTLIYIGRKYEAVFIENLGDEIFKFRLPGCVEEFTDKTLQFEAVGVKNSIGVKYVGEATVYKKRDIYHYDLVNIRLRPINKRKDVRVITKNQKVKVYTVNNTKDGYIAEVLDVSASGIHFKMRDDITEKVIILMLDFVKNPLRFNLIEKKKIAGGYEYRGSFVNVGAESLKDLKSFISSMKNKE